MPLAFVWMSSRHLNENNKKVNVFLEFVYAFHWENDVRKAGAYPTGLSVSAYKNNPTKLTIGPQGIYFHLLNKHHKGMNNMYGLELV